MRFLEAVGILLAAFTVLFVLRLGLEFWVRGVARDAKQLIGRGCTSPSSNPKGGKCTNPNCVRR